MITYMQKERNPISGKSQFYAVVVKDSVSAVIQKRYVAIGDDGYG